jgi:hypothetical protein
VASCSPDRVVASRIFFISGNTNYDESDFNFAKIREIPQNFVVLSFAKFCEITQNFI